MRAAALGPTLSHEHLFIDLTSQFVEPADPQKRRLSSERITLANSGVLRRNPYAIRDNLILDDLEVAVDEVQHFQRLGGRTIVDCTSLGINRSPLLLKELAQRTGLHIIAGCGYYTQDTHPPEMALWSADEIAQRLVVELTEGIQDTGIRAGVIGEIGTGDPIHPNERKCLLAAGLASRRSGAPVYVHTYPWAQEGVQAAELLLEQAVEPDRIVICHVDVELADGYLRALLDRGVFVEFDNFGKEFTIDRSDRVFAGGIFARDIDRVRAIRRLVDGGWVRQILITNDICLKSMLHAYGGWGYDHILRHVVPMMLDEGIDAKVVEMLLVGNPARLLSR